MATKHNHYEFDSIKKAVSLEDLNSLLKAWSALSGVVAKKLELGSNEKLVWLLTNGKPKTKTNLPHCLAEIQWWQSGKLVAVLSGAYVSPHQAEPENIENYAEFIVRILKTRKEKAAKTA